MLHTSKQYYQVVTGNTLLYLLSLWNSPSCWQAVAASSGLKRRLQTVPQALLMQTSTLPSLVKFSGLSLPTSLRSPVVQFPGSVVEGSRNIWRCSFNSQSINACYTRIFQDSLTKALKKYNMEYIPWQMTLASSNRPQLLTSTLLYGQPSSTVSFPLQAKLSTWIGRLPSANGELFRAIAPVECKLQHKIIHLLYKRLQWKVETCLNCPESLTS